MSSFSDLGLDPILVATLTKLGYETPTPVQLASLPPLIAGHDVLAEAATGTGKTAAFALPLLQRLQPFMPKTKPRALVLVPTRELAMQVRTAMVRYSTGLKCNVVAVYGGASIGQQIGEINRGAHIIVATPGRAVDLLERKALDFSMIEAIVLDEADEMLDMGFSEDLDKLLSAAPKPRQTALFSATMPKHIAALAKRHQTNPIHLQVARAVSEGDEPLVEQLAVICRDEHKLAAFERVLLSENPVSALVFCRTREDVDDVCAALNADGFAADALHGGHSQVQRDAVMQRFRRGKTKLLIATDVAARGLDVSSMSHVFNFDLPESPEVYVHRIGRTGRAGKTGKAISLCPPHRTMWLGRFEKKTHAKITELQVPTTKALHKLQLASLESTLEPLFLEPNEETLALVQEWAAAHSAEAVATAALSALTRELFGRQNELLEKVPDAAFHQGRMAKPRPSPGMMSRPPPGRRPYPARSGPAPKGGPRKPTR